MPMSPGTRLGPFEIIGPLGKGGMGEVYRALDTRLAREVAIKFLPDAFAADRDRLSRFEREAKTLASLSHPNIAQIHGIESNAIVMELVPGEDLAERIARGPIPIDEALPIARQIADALAAAHEQGVIHRDLKPANIRVRDDGTVKVLDFGLAKALDPAGGSDVMSAPTVTSPATMLGVVLGTAAYMSPEQAKGKPVDRRSDVWAFGCVLFEMLTARRAFEGDTISEVLAAVLKDPVPFDALPVSSPPAIRRLLRMCLEKDRARRLDSMTAARIEIDDVMRGVAPDAASGHAPARASWIDRRVLIVAAVAAVVTSSAVAVLLWKTLRPEPPSPVRVSLTISGLRVSVDAFRPDVALTADGHRVLFWSLPAAGNERQLAVRSLDQFEAVRVSGFGSGGARELIGSPDGQWVAYQRGISGPQQLMKAPIAGGEPVVIGPTPQPLRGGSWGDDGHIVYAMFGSAAGLFRVSSNGGEPEVLTKPARDNGEIDHLLPHVLPGSTHVLFTVARRANPPAIAVLDLSSRTWRTLIENATMPRYVSSGHLVFASAGTLRAARYDLRRHALTTTPLEIVPIVGMKGETLANYDVSRHGALVYLLEGASTTPSTLTWIDRSGKRTELNAGQRAFSAVRPSPDGRAIAATIDNGGVHELWLIDTERGTVSRLTEPGMNTSSPVWSADGSKLAFQVVSSRTGASIHGIYQMAVTGTAPMERLTEAKLNTVHLPTSWNADGTELFFHEMAGSFGDIYKVRSGGAATPLLTGPGNEAHAALSPDGKWLAYSASESGTLEVYVRPYPDVAAYRVQVSTAGGGVPSWIAGGRELIYSANGVPMRVSMSASGGRPIFGTPVPYADIGSSRGAWAPTRDGARLLAMVRATGTTEPREFRLVLNFAEELKRRVK